jgi:ATP-dependent DNA helicase RecG
VDLAGDVLVVVSPGGFPFGVTEDNVISTPSRPRNRALADLARAMRLAEQEGTGVDRMYRELIFRGLPRPELQETPGMNVRCALSGGAPVRHVVDLVSRLSVGVDEDTDIALILDRLLHEPRINADDLPRLLQKTRVEAASALRRAAQETAGLLDTGLISPAEGPAPQDRWWRLSDVARAIVHPALPYVGTRAAEHARWAVWLGRQAGQVRAADLRDTLGVTATQASRALAQALEEGDLVPGSTSMRGRGVRYLPVG